MDTVLNFLNKKVGTQHELRLQIDLSKLILSKTEVLDIALRVKSIAKTNEFETQSITMDYGKCQKLNWFSNGINLKQQLVRNLKYVRSYKYSDKKDIAKSFDLHINTDAVCMVSPAETLKRVCLEYTYGFCLPDDLRWTIRLVLTKEISDQGQFMTKLPEFKSRIFPTKDETDQDAKHTLDKMLELDIDNAETAAYDYLQFVISLNDTSAPVTKQQVFDICKKVQNMLRSEAYAEAQEYQNVIYECSKFVYRDPMITDKYKSKSGFKRLVNNVVELSRSMYLSDLKPHISDYFVTDKIDGKRAFLIIDEYWSGRSTKSSAGDRHLGSNVRAISDKIYEIESYRPDTRAKKNTHVFDCEMLSSSSKFEFFAFDLIAINSRSTCYQPFHKRLDMLRQHENILTRHGLGKVKTFIRLDPRTYGTQITDLYKKVSSSKYETDGLIFTPAGEDYKTAKAKLPENSRARPINTDYHNTISYKWKPVDKQSIDFYMLKVPSEYWSGISSSRELDKDKSLYALCSGVNSAELIRLNIKAFPGYSEITKGRFDGAQYFPIQFSPDDLPMLYLFQSKQGDLDNKVGEFVYNHKTSQFELMRVRDDRDVEIERGEYYGNAMKYAELIWHAIKYPLTLEMICSNANDMYFASSDNDAYYSQRAFNSFVKQKLLDSLPKGSILDLMAGRGQDLARMFNAGYKSIYLMDKDVDALYELLQRKYNMKIKNTKHSASIHLREIDMGDDFDTNLSKALSLKGLAAGSLDAITINFAIHYIMDNENKIRDAARLISTLLKSGGQVSITCFDGASIMSLIGDQDKWTGIEKQSTKYEIVKQYKSQELTDVGQAIGVLLPFSGSQYYTEYLVNSEYLQRVFADHGLSLKTSGSFGSKLSAFSKENHRVYGMLTELDKQYVSLYRYFVFEKK